jgi:hypothetical protein
MGGEVKNDVGYEHPKSVIYAALFYSLAIHNRWKSARITGMDSNTVVAMS